MPGLKWDYHTHTIYSRHNHGKGTVEENVRAALEKGLKEIAISDHGPGHVMYGIQRDRLGALRQEIEAAAEKYPQIQIFMSVEANIINRSGELDVLAEEWDRFDFVMAGYHYGAFCSQPAHDLRVHTKNFLLNTFHTTTRKMKTENTELILNALYKNDIKILTHPGDKAGIYISEVAKACRDTGTWMEINNSHPFLSEKTLEESAKEDVTFVIGSDAHVPHRVGNYANALARITASGIDRRRVINLME